MDRGLAVALVHSLPVPLLMVLGVYVLFGLAAAAVTVVAFLLAFAVLANVIHGNHFYGGPPR